MSQLKTLSIQGIRSFGFLEDHVQVVTFLSPVTLIVGPNGTGKTTVIECLRYATTGELPPGSKQGGAFVYDPKMAGYSEVRGQIRLSFTDVTGKLMRVQRSLVALLKKTGTSIRTLEGLIAREGTDGTVHQITSRCAEIDREVMTALGVPKAVLENVIFCHQEDSNWPLSEGKCLKSKFDDIFAATKYIKILETLRKTRQEKAQELKLYRAEIVHLRRYKEKAKSLKESLEENQNHQQTSTTKIEQIENSLLPIENKLKEITKEAKRVYEMQRIIDKLENQKKSIEDRIYELEQIVTESFTDPNMVRGKITELDALKYQNDMKLASLKQNSRSLCDKQVEVKTDFNKLITELATLNSQISTADECKTKQAHVIQELSNIFKFKLDNPDFRSVSEKSDSIKRKLIEFKNTYDKEIADIEKELDSVKLLKMSFTEKVSADRTMETKLNREIIRITEKLDEAQRLSESVQNIEEEINNLEGNLSVLETAIRKTTESNQIQKLEQEQQTISSEIEVCQQKLDQLLISSRASMEIDILKQSIQSKENQRNRIQFRIEESVQDSLGDAEFQNHKAISEDKIRNLNIQLNQFARNVQNVRSKLVSKEECKRMKTLTLRNTEGEVDRVKERILSILSSIDDYDSTLSKVQLDLDTKREEYGLLNGSENTYKKFIKRMQEQIKSQSENYASCPLCCRQFSKEQDCKDLINDMEEIIKSLPKKKSILEKDIKICETSLGQLIGLKSTISRLGNQTKEIDEVKREIDILTEEINDLRRDLKSLDDSSTIASREKAKLEEILPDILTMDRLYSEISSLKQKLMGQTDNTYESTENVEDVKSNRETLKKRLETVNIHLREARQQHQRDTDKLHNLRDSLAQKRDSRFKAVSAGLNQETLVENKTRLGVDLKIQRDMSIHNRNELTNAEDAVRMIENRKTDIINTKKIQIQILEDEVRTMNQLLDRFKEYQKIIKRCTETLEPSKTCLLSQKETIEKCLLDYDQQTVEISSQIQKCQKIINSYESEVRGLHDALQLCDKRRELTELNKEIQLQSSEFSGLKVCDLAADEKSLRSQQDALLKEKHTTAGRLAGISTLIADIKIELSESNYNKAEQNFMERMISVNVLESACSDIEKYYSVLDKAVMTYHSSKMSELNKIIRDLWSTTYKGNDIDHIEIRSEADDGSGAAKARRSYNYRVVMIRAGISMDMRGRCSAGQKVLASLIIRLALAEAFGVQCGIIALDEPTTNLDRENIESLAFSLIEIIESRCVQRQFQLIIITHDEDFVEMLSRSNFVDKFYRIQKDEKSYSRIYSCDTSDLR